MGRDGEGRGKSGPPFGAGRRSTLVVTDEEARALRAAPQQRDRCTLTMLAGPSPGSLFEMGGGRVYVGRDPACSVRIDDAGLSTIHARIELRSGRFTLADEGSTNGTFLNGNRVTEPQELRDGDRIQMGAATLLKVSLHDEVEQEAQRKLYESATRDALTGIHNRRFLWERLPGEHAFALRHGSPLAALIMDLDHFKSLNDTHGHLAGDEVLRVVAREIAPLLRREDLFARYGGEEFVILTRGVGADGALTLGQRLRIAIEALEIPWGGKLLRVTASIGVAAMDSATKRPSPDALLAAADEALYRAKNEGRNQVRS